MLMAYKIIFVTLQFMHYIFDFNFLPNRETFKHATRLLLKEFETQLPANVMSYLKENYLDENRPELLGGRFVGWPLQGLNGSTQGPERWGGHIKKTFNKWTAGMKKAEKENPIHFLGALAAKVINRGRPIEKFVSSPVVTEANFAVIKTLSGWTKTTLDGKVYQDWAFMQCLVDGQPVNLADAIGTGRKSYTVYVPQGGLVYSFVRKIKSDDRMTTGLEFGPHDDHNMSSNSVDLNNKNFKYWRGITSQLTNDERAKLYSMLEQACLDHTVEPKPNESLRQYLDRWCRRLPEEEKQSRLNLDIWDKTTSLEARKKMRDEDDKWQNSEHNYNKKDKKKKKTQKKGAGKAVDAVELAEQEILEREKELTVELGENPSIDLLLEHLGYLMGIDDSEKETLKKIMQSELIKVPRQLGHWNIINVDAVEMKAKCICEKCNCDGRCYWVDTFESIEFGLEPTAKQMSGNQPTEGYQSMVQQAVHIIKHMNARPLALKLKEGTL